SQPVGTPEQDRRARQPQPDPERGGLDRAQPAPGQRPVGGPPHPRVTRPLHPLVQRAGTTGHQGGSQQGQRQRRGMSTAAGTEQEANADGHQHHHDDARLGERDVSRNLVSGRGQRGLGRGGGKNRLSVRNRRFQATTSRLPETDALPAAVVSGRSPASPWTPAPTRRWRQARRASTTPEASKSAALV